jgi:hypothetical protein
MMVLGHVGLLTGPSESAHEVNLQSLIDISPQTGGFIPGRCNCCPGTNFSTPPEVGGF